MDLSGAISATGQSAAVLVFTGLVAPAMGLLLRRVAGGWDSIGKGPFAIEQQQPSSRSRGQAAEPVDPAIQAAEVRQMLKAKRERQARRGEAPIDVEAESARLLAAAATPDAGGRQEAELRTEVRQLVIARNARRMHRGLEPLDVEAETERQLADFIGSP